MNDRGQPYGIFVIRGTQPHAIAPRNVPRLKFFWISRGVPFRTSKPVNHKGTAPNNFLAEAARRVFGR